MRKILDRLSELVPVVLMLFAMLAIFFVGAIVKSPDPKPVPGTEVIPGVGAVIDSGTTANTVTLRFPRQARGSIINKGSATVYIAWNTTTPPSADTTAAVGKCYLASGDACTIPKNAANFVHLTASGSAKLIYIED